MRANALWFQNFFSQDQRAEVLKLTTCGFIAYIHPNARIVSEKQEPVVRSQKPAEKHESGARIERLERSPTCCSSFLILTESMRPLFF
jgi:hypothetical protein